MSKEGMLRYTRHIYKDIYSMFLKNCRICKFSIGYLITMPLHEDYRTQQFLINNLNYEYLKREYRIQCGE